jgi:hypothetical protein
MTSAGMKLVKSIRLRSLRAVRVLRPGAVVLMMMGALVKLRRDSCCSPETEATASDESA